MANISQEDLIKKAFEDLEKTNKRVMLMRKKVPFILCRMKKEWKIFKN